MSGLLRPRSTSTIVTTMINYVITGVRVADINIPMSKYYITCKHYKTFIMINTIVVTMLGGIMDGLTKLIPYTYVITNCEIT